VGSLRGPAETGQGHQIVSYWTLNNTLNGIVLTSGYVEDLGNVRLRVWGQRGRWQGGRGGPRSCKADSCCTWAVGWATGISEAYAIYVHTYVRTWEGRSWGRYGDWRDLGKVMGCKLNGALGGIVLTCGYAGSLVMCGWVCGGCEGERGGRGSPRSCGADSCCGWAVGRITSVSGVHTRYVNVYIHGGVAPGVDAVQPRFSRCKRLVTQQRLETYCTHLCVCRRP